MAAILRIAKPQSAPEKHTRSVVDTIIVTAKVIEEWNSPFCQRPLKENAKVLDLAESIKTNGGVIPGIITIGILDGKKYLIDGQHRVKCFLISGLEEGYTDVRYLYVESEGQIGEEFAKLNGHLVPTKPDDNLRALEKTYAALSRIRHACPFVGYDFIRRTSNAPVVSMSVVLRLWRSSQAEVPSSSACSSQIIAQTMDSEDCEHLIGFLNIAVAAFGRDMETVRLWAGLNLTLCMWLYRRLVLSQYSSKTPRLTRDQFKKCLMALAADPDYHDWLVGRHLGERDRSSAYNRIKPIFASRLTSELGGRPMLPQPAWSANSGHSKR
jgi:hypothetical protein